MNRTEHMEWCKKRALKYVDVGDLQQAFASMASDITQHPETKNHPGVELGMMLMMAGQLNTNEQMRKFILGFN